MYIDSLTYEQFMMLGDAELSRRFSMQDEAEQKAKIDREQANELEYVDESQKSDAAESANASNGSTGAKPVRNPERESLSGRIPSQTECYTGHIHRSRRKR